MTTDVDHPPDVASLVVLGWFVGTVAMTTLLESVLGLWTGTAVAFAGSLVGVAFAVLEELSTPLESPGGDGGD